MLLMQNKDWERIWIVKQIDLDWTLNFLCNLHYMEITPETLFLKDLHQYGLPHNWIC